MNKKRFLAGFLTILLIISVISSAFAGESVTIAMSLTVPAIPGLNAPPSIPETALNNYSATVGLETIEKEERKETLLAQGEKVTELVKTIYAR